MGEVADAMIDLFGVSVLDPELGGWVCDCFVRKGGGGGGGLFFAVGPVVGGTCTSDDELSATSSCNSAICAALAAACADDSATGSPGVEGDVSASSSWSSSVVVRLSRGEVSSQRG
jgi:hypothetical protein